jgi:hypothetical protein
MRGHNWKLITPSVSTCGRIVWVISKGNNICSSDEVTKVWKCDRCQSVIKAMRSQSQSQARRYLQIPTDCDMVLIREVMRT